MYIKITKSHRYVVALCDAELIGKYFEDGDYQLEIKELFYKGEKTDPDSAIQRLKDLAIEDATFNIVGQKAINTAIKAGIIDKDSIGKIADIPYALILI